MARSLPYTPGDVFGVPLRDEGFALGVVARMDGKGIVLGYFFGPRLSTLEGMNGSIALNCTDAIRVCRFGDLRLIKKKWPVLGKIEQWDPVGWPVPMFCRNGEVCVSYDPDSLNVVRQEPCDSRECATLPEDGLEGAGFVEIKLTRLLAAE